MKADRLQQEDLDVRWVKKNGIFHYGYKYSICINVKHRFVRRYAVIPTNIYDSQILLMILDSQYTDDFVLAGSAYAGERFETY